MYTRGMLQSEYSQCLSTQEAKKKDEKLLKFPEKLQDVQSAAR